ncbi:MAG: hypothetical protein IKI58_04740 [Oscillospiraceae bacterium]|nr:hypothetical protein [Oscillospiraceae bacterium]
MDPSAATTKPASIVTQPEHSDLDDISMSDQPVYVINYFYTSREEYNQKQQK